MNQIEKHLGYQIPESVTITVFPYEEDMEPDFEDEETVKQVKEDMESNEWAWCRVEVKALFGEAEATEHLGGCSYKDGDDFVTGGYFVDLAAQAVQSLAQSAMDVAAQFALTLVGYAWCIDSGGNVATYVLPRDTAYALEVAKRGGAHDGKIYPLYMGRPLTE